MRNNKTSLMALLLCVATSAGAQQDTPHPHGAAGFAVPGSTAMTFDAPVSMPAAPAASPLTIGGQPANDRKRHTDKADAHSQAPTPADTVCYGPAGMLPAQNSFYAYPAPLSVCRNYGGLHQGLNVSLGMSVFAAFGKNAPKGAGFAQNLSATWLQPLGNRGWIAAGGYISHANRAGNNYTSGGLHGQVGYLFNEHWAGYIYGQKNIVGNGLPFYGLPYGYGPYNCTPLPYDETGDRLGAAVRWMPNPTLSVELSVEKNWYPQSGWSYPDRYKYNYPVPQNIP